MPLINRLTESQNRNARPHMDEVRAEYIIVGDQLQINTFSISNDNPAQTIRFTPDALRRLSQIIAEMQP